MLVKNRIQLRRGTSVQWSNTVNILADGELGFDSDANNVKVGNGTDLWADLPWLIVAGVSGQIINPAVISGLSGLFLDTSIGDVDLVAGQLGWNSEAGTAEIGLTNDTKIAIGQSVLFRIKNSTGSTLSKGQAVYASGVLGGGQIIQAAPFAVDGAVDEVRFIGLMTDDLANGDDGFVNHFGHIKNVDLRTSNTAINPNAETWSVGDILYVDDSSPGGLTKTAPQDTIYVAMVLADGQNGELFVRITDSGHINDLHDVNTSGLIDNNLLAWNSGAATWEPTTNLYYVDGKIGIGQTSPTYQLEVDGSFSASTKSFKIRHPYSRKFNTLEYGSLESPYHGIRLTGKAELKNGECKVKLPQYIKHLVKEEDINIQITNYKHGKTLYVDNIDLNKNCFTIKGHRCKTSGQLEFFWTFTAIRKDVPDLVVEK